MANILTRPVVLNFFITTYDLSIVSLLVPSKYLFVTLSTTNFIQRLISWIYLNANGDIIYYSCSLSVFLHKLLYAPPTLSLHIRNHWRVM